MGALHKRKEHKGCIPAHLRILDRLARLMPSVIGRSHRKCSKPSALRVKVTRHTCHQGRMDTGSIECVQARVVSPTALPCLACIQCKPCASPDAVTNGLCCSHVPREHHLPEPTCELSMACMPMPAVLTSKLTSVHSSFTASTSFFRMLPASQGDCRKMLTQVFRLWQRVSRHAAACIACLAIAVLRTLWHCTPAD